MKKQIVIHNTNEKFNILYEGGSGKVNFIVNGESDYLPRKGKTDKELIEHLINCYAEPQATIYIR